MELQCSHQQTPRPETSRTILIIIIQAIDPATSCISTFSSIRNGQGHLGLTASARHPDCRSFRHRAPASHRVLAACQSWLRCPSTRLATLATLSSSRLLVTMALQNIRHYLVEPRHPHMLQSLSGGNCPSRCQHQSEK